MGMGASDLDVWFAPTTTPISAALRAPVSTSERGAFSPSLTQRQAMAGNARTHPGSPVCLG
jgi:hypothetical protein